MRAGMNVGSVKALSLQEGFADLSGYLGFFAPGSLPWEDGNTDNRELLREREVSHCTLMLPTSNRKMLLI